TFDPDEAERMGRDEKKPVVLVPVETSPDDVHGILHSKGVLTARGGATSHAAVVTRGLGIPCVTGCESIVVDYDEGLFRVGGKVVHRGDFVSIDGSSGEVFEGRIPTIDPDFQKVSARGRAIRAEIDTAKEARRSTLERRLATLEPVLEDLSRRYLGSLEKLGRLQKTDFEGILRAMQGLPVIIRLIDPPLHE